MAEPLSIHTLRNPNAHRFVDAWLRWRGDAPVPRRGQMNLRDIVEELPMVVLHEWRGPDDVHVRLSGTGMCRLFGRDTTGMNYAELTPAAHWPTRRYRLEAMVRQPCGGVMFHDEIVGSAPISVTSVTLPLLADERGGNPLLFTYVVPPGPLVVSGAAPLARLARLPDAFSFVDIGAGAPNSIDP